MYQAPHLILELAEIDNICENCGRQITIGEDYYYDDSVEEVHCVRCVEEEENSSSMIDS